MLENKAKKPEKLAYIEKHTEVDWSQIEANNDGTYGKAKVNSYIVTLQSAFDFPEDSFTAKLQKASALMVEDSSLKKQIKQDAAALHELTKSTIEELSDEQVTTLLRLKWIEPLSHSLHQLPTNELEKLISAIQHLMEKYKVTYSENAKAIKKTENALSEMIGELEGNDFDMQGLEAFKILLKSE